MTQSLAAVYDGSPEVRQQSFATPTPRGSEILVRVLGCTLCGSDLHTIDGRRQVPVPSILGHEIVGEILHFGQSADRSDARAQPLVVGDRITWAVVAACQSCYYCLRGLPQKCLKATKYGHEPLKPGYELSGGLAEHCLLVEGTRMVRIPDAMSLAVACPASCATATTAGALRAAGQLQERSVLVIGAGMLGLTACAMAAARGASHVVCVDLQPSRLEMARRFGASHIAIPDEVKEQIGECTQGRGVDIALEMSGSANAFGLGVNSLRIGGSFILIGTVLPTPAVSLDMEQVVRRCLRIQGIHNYTPDDLVDAIDFLHVHQHRFPFDCLVSDWFSLGDIDHALQAARRPGTIRVGIAG